MYYGLYEPTCHLRPRSDTYCGCGAYLSCPEDETVCTNCDTPMCHECVASRICETCKEPCCDDCITICDHCGERLCPMCKKSGDLPSCVVCGTHMCGVCADKCPDCGATLCEDCYDTDCAKHVEDGR